MATFNSNAKIFDTCLLDFFKRFNINSIIDVENLDILTKGENLDKLYLNNEGKIIVKEDNSNNFKKFSLTDNIDIKDIKQVANVITKIKKKESTPDFDKALPRFRALFCNEQGNYKKQFIQYITSLLLENSNLPYIQDICYDFIKSFLNAEFLILNLNDFSAEIETTINSISDYYENFANIQKDKQNPSFHIIKSFIRVLFYAIEMCNKHEHYLSNSDKRLICINNDRKSRFYSTRGLSQVDFIIGRKESLPYERLMESVIDMTIIDLDYTVTEENFDKLFRLWRRIKVINPQCNEDWEKTIFMLKTKTAILLMRMLKSKLKNRDYEIVNIEEDEKEEIKKYYYRNIIDDDLFKQNPFIEIINDYQENNAFNLNQFSELLKNCFLDKKNYKDICAYDDYAKEGIEIFCNNSPYFKDNLSNDEIRTLNDLLVQSNHKHLNSQTLFVNLIKNIYKDVDGKLKIVKDNSNKNERDYNYDTYKKTIGEIEVRLSLLSKLLVEMERFIERAKTNKIKQFSPIFAYSFYEVCEQNNEPETNAGNENYKISFANNFKNKIETYNATHPLEFKNYFFIASAGLAPVNIFYIETELITWKINIQELNFNYDHVLSEAAVKAERKEIKEEIRRTLSINKTESEKTTIEIKEEIKEETKQLQRETITILGVFAALLAFVTASIGFIKIANNLFEYAVFDVMFVSALLMFVIVVNLIWKNKSKNETNIAFFWKYFAPPVSIILFMIVMLFILHKCNFFF